MWHTASGDANGCILCQDEITAMSSHAVATGDFAWIPPFFRISQSLSKSDLSSLVNSPNIVEGKEAKSRSKGSIRGGKIVLASGFRRLIDWLIDSLDPLLDWWFNRSINRWVHWTIHLLLNWSMDWLSDLSIEAVCRMRTWRRRMKLSWKMTPTERLKTGKISKPTFTIPGIYARHGGLNRINQQSAREQRIGRWFFSFKKLDFTACTWRFDDFSSWSFHVIAEPIPLSRLAWRHPEGMPFVFLASRISFFNLQ